MNFKNEISQGTFSSPEYSGLLNGMCCEDVHYKIERGLEILNTYEAVKEESYPSGGYFHLSFGTQIPLSYSDKEELVELGWYQSSCKWPPDSESIEQYGFNTIQLHV